MTHNVEHRYLVVKVSASDKAASNNPGEFHFDNPSGDDIDLLEYDSTYTFDGSETSFIEIDGGSKQHALLPIFYDYSSEPDAESAGLIYSPYRSAARALMLFQLDIVFDGHRLKNEMSEADQNSLDDQIEPLYLCATMGNVNIMRRKAIDIRDGSPVAPLTLGIIDELIARLDAIIAKHPNRF